MMWLDHCIDLVLNSSVRYDLILRMRPDIGVFAPIPWWNISLNRVSIMLKDSGGIADFFFTIPTKLIDGWWKRAVRQYLKGGSWRSIDTVLFSRKRMRVTNFPAVIVRDGYAAQCWRIVGSLADRQNCIAKEQAGYFAKLHWLFSTSLALTNII